VRELDEEKICPVKLGEEYSFKPFGLGKNGGDPVAKIEGFIVFVKGGAVGVEQRARITKVSEKYAMAEVVK
jgi:predicted RNA-binding protein with TRAM domain